MLNSVSDNSPNTRDNQFEPVAFNQPQINTFVPTILLVEDDEDNRQMLKLMLEIWKYRVLEAKNGEEAVDLAEKEQPSIILMDVQMPELDGFEAARLIRQSNAVDGVPIVFLSGCAQNLYRQTAFDAGGNEYFVKPIDFAELELTLKKYTCQ